GEPAYAGGVASCKNPSPTPLPPTATTKGVMRPRQGARHFALRRFDPGPPVDRYVENYWAVRWDLTGRPAYRQEIIPHPCVNVTVEAGSPGEVRHGFAMPAVLLHGLPTRRFAVDLTGTGQVLGVRFRPGGFAALTGHGAGALRDRVMPLGQVFGAAADMLANDVLAEEDDERRGGRGGGGLWGGRGGGGARAAARGGARAAEAG